MIKIEHSPGNQKVFIKIDTSKKSIRDGIRRAFYLLGKDLVDTAKQGMLKGPKTGRVITIKGVRHQQSAPGEYPASRKPAIRRATNQPSNNESRLAFSLGFNVVGSRELHFGSKVPHGKFLQEGTSKMKPRPFLTKSANTNQRNAQKHFTAQIGKRL